MDPVVTDRNGNELREGVEVFRPGELTPVRVLTVDGLRAKPVQVRVGWHHDGNTYTPLLRWYRGTQLERV